MEVQQHIEALLFTRGEPLAKKDMPRMLGVTEEEVLQGIAALRKELAGRGVVLVETEDEVELRAASGASELLMRLLEEERARPLGNAAQETLAVILYRGPISRARIEHVRGVNCQSILRSLLMRGLITRKEKERGQAVYEPSTELLAFLGVQSREELPDFEKTREALLREEQWAQASPLEPIHATEETAPLPSDKTSPDGMHP